MFLFIFLLDDKLTDGPALFDLMVHLLFVLGPGCFCDHKNRNSSYCNQSVTGSEVNTISAEQAEAFFSNHKKTSSTWSFCRFLKLLSVGFRTFYFSHGTDFTELYGK